MTNGVRPRRRVEAVRVVPQSKDLLYTACTPPRRRHARLMPDRASLLAATAATAAAAAAAAGTLSVQLGAGCIRLGAQLQAEGGQAGCVQAHPLTNSRRSFSGSVGTPSRCSRRAMPRMVSLSLATCRHSQGGEDRAQGRGETLGDCGESGSRGGEFCDVEPNPGRSSLPPPPHVCAAR